MNHSRSIIGQVLLGAVCSCHLACVSNRVSFESENKLVQSLKRVGVKKMTPAKDQRKPLAAVEEGGWVASKGLLFGAANRQWVGAFQADSLEPVWWLKSGKGLTTAPLAFDSRVFFAFRTGELVSVDHLSGKKHWSLTLDAFVDQAMIAHQDRLFVITAAKVLHCLDIKTGKVLWNFDFSGQGLVSIKSLASPVVMDDKLFLGTHDGAVCCLNLVDGTLLWQLEPEVSGQHLFKNVVGDLSVYKDQLIVTRYDGWVGAIKLVKGQLETKPSIDWVLKHKLGLITSSKINGGSLFVATVEGHVVSIDLESKLVKWRYALAESVQSLLVGEKQLYVMTTQGMILLFDRVQGRLLWSDRLDAAISGKPILLDEYMVFATGMNNLYYYRVLN